MVIAQAGVDRAGSEQIRARSDLFPQLSAAASYDRALASEFEGLFDVSDELGDLDELPFGQKNTWRLNFSLSQSLYTGGRIAAQSDVANASRQNAEINLASTRAQVMLDLVRAYYDVALTERLVEIAEATYQQADATYEQVRVAYQAGNRIRSAMPARWRSTSFSASRASLRPTSSGMFVPPCILSILESTCWKVGAQVSVVHACASGRRSRRRAAGSRRR